MVEGREVSLRSPQDARREGIETVFQDLALAPNRDVVQNLFLGRELLRGGPLGRAGVLDKAEMRRRAVDQTQALENEHPAHQRPPHRQDVRRSAPVGGGGARRLLGTHRHAHG